MSFARGILSIAKGRIKDLIEGLTIIINKVIKSISRGSSNIWSRIGIGIKSIASIIIAKKTKINPPGERSILVGIF